jgi:predicted MFS family arabinose efflux permease
LLAIVPLILGPEQHWPIWTWLCLALSVPAGAVFVAVEGQVARSGGHPLVNLEVLSVPRVALGLIAAGAALATYFAMLFVLALYLQQGLGRSPLYSGLALVSWVAAFGISGPLLRRIAPTQVPFVAVAGYLILAASYLALSASLALGQGANGVLLMTLLGFGGLGLGLGRNSSIADMTNSVADRFAADMSGLINTASQLSGAAGVALFGTLYVSIAPEGGFDQAPAFEIVSLGFAGVALLASAAGYAAFAKRAAPAPAPSGA